MERIFTKPIILDGGNNNVVLIYSKYIIGNMTKEIADLAIKKIDENSLNSNCFECLIKIKEIFKYKFYLDNDSCIKFGVKNVTGINYVTIDFKDAATTKEAELSFMEQFTQWGFKRKEEQITPVNAAAFPLILTIITAVSGNLLTWFAFEIKDYEITQNQIVNGYIYVFEKGLQMIGYYPILLVTVLLLAVCLFWIFKKISHLPYRIIANR